MVNSYVIDISECILTVGDIDGVFLIAELECGIEYRMENEMEW